MLDQEHVANVKKEQRVMKQLLEKLPISTNMLPYEGKWSLEMSVLLYTGKEG